MAPRITDPSRAIVVVPELRHVIAAPAAAAGRADIVTGSASSAPAPFIPTALAPEDEAAKTAASQLKCDARLDEARGRIAQANASPHLLDTFLGLQRAHLKLVAADSLAGGIDYDIGARRDEIALSGARFVAECLKKTCFNYRPEHGYLADPQSEFPVVPVDADEADTPPSHPDARYQPHGLDTLAWLLENFSSSIKGDSARDELKAIYADVADAFGRSADASREVSKDLDERSRVFRAAGAKLAARL